MAFTVRPGVRGSTLATALLLASAALVPHPSSAPPSTASGLHRVSETTTTMTLRQREDRFAARVLVLVNQRRASHGLRPVQGNPCVGSFSRSWAETLVRRDAFEHSDLTRLLSLCTTRYASENIAKVPSTITPRTLVGLWMRSPDHRRNILSTRPTATGVAVRYDAAEHAYVAVQNFARHPGS